MLQKNKIKIALICPADFTVVLCCKWIIKTLREMGHEVIVISPLSSDDFFIKKIKEFNVPHISIKMNRHINIFDDFTYIYSLIRIFRNYKINTVFAVCTKPNIYVPIAAKIIGIKDIYTSVWGRGTAFLNKKSFRGKLIKKLLLLLYKLSFLISKKIWFTNPSDMRYFIKRNILKRKKAVLTHNYIDSDIYLPNKLSKGQREILHKEFKIKKGTTVIILVGRMIWSKGIREFVEAGKILNKKYNGLKFLLVGAEEPNNPDAVPRAYLDDLSKLSFIIWTNFRKDVPALYSISNIAVLPSFYKEGGYPRAITEPMSMEIPVIAADTEDCRGPIVDMKNGLLVKAKDAIDLANKIEILIKDNDFSQKISKEARKTILNEFDEKIIIKELFQKIFN